MLKNKFRKRSHEIPELNTSSLPDLIFTVLFFFMIVTNMRQDTVKVKFREPAGTQLEKLENKSLVTNIYIGPSLYPGKTGSASCIQINDKIVEPSQVKSYMTAERMRLNESERENMVVNLKVDKNTPMSLVEQVKDALSKAYVLKIVYIGTKTKKQK